MPERSDREERVGEAVAWYFQAAEAGRSPEPADFLARFPDLRTELESFLADKAAFDRAAGPLPSPDATLPPSTTPDTNTISHVPSGDEDQTLPPSGQQTATDALGSVRYFGDYELLAEIARGGMGVVFKARQVSLNREVALKMILTGQLASASDVARFRAEAEAAANLDHPNILPIYEVGEHRGQQYFAMKLAPGGSLAAKVTGLVQDPKAAVEVFTKVCRAVDFAHRRGILHRDLKPGNILLDADGTPYVTDFGLAKKVEGDSNLTQSGAIVGTPSYMAPEQARAEKGLTTAADVYALGAILYELLTGQPPFRGPTMLDTILQVLEKEPVDPRSLSPKADRDLSVIALKCLEKDPGKRYESAVGLADDLDRWMAGEPITARPVGRGERVRKWVRRNPGLAAGVGAAVLSLVVGSVASTGFGLWASESARMATKEAEAQKVAVRKAQRLLGLMNASEGVKLADDGHLSLGLLKMAQALVIAPESPEAEAMSRAQLAMYRRHSGPVYTLTQLLSHGGPVVSVAFSPDGRQIVTGSEDMTAQVWDVDTGKPLAPPLEHTGQVLSVAFSPNGRRILTGSYDKTARVWDADTGKPLAPPLKHTGAVTAVVFSPDGLRILTGSMDGTAWVWDADTGKALSPPLKHDSSVLSVAFSPEGRRILTRSGDSTARVWDADTSKALSPLLQHTELVLSVVFSPDGQRFLTGRGDHTARVWDANTGKPLSPPLEHTGPVMAVAFSPDGRRVLTGSQDMTARVWDADTGKALSPPLQHNGQLSAVAFSPDGRRALTASDDKTARVWDADTGKPLSPSLQHSARVEAVAFSPDGRRALTASKDMTARLWDIDTVQPFASPLRHANPVQAVAFNPDSQRVLTGSLDGTAQLWDADTGKALSPPLQHNGWVVSVAFSPDGRRALTGSLDKTAQLWEADTGKALSPSLQHNAAVSSVAFSPDGRRILTDSGDHTARVWDADTGKVLFPPLQYSGSVLALAFSPDGRQILTGSEDNTAQLWDLVTGKPLFPPLQHNGPVWAVAFRPDGRRALTGSYAKTAQLWDVDTGKPLFPPLQHNGPVSSVAFSPNGQRILTGISRSHDTTARVWDADTGKPLSPPLQHAGGVVSVAFSPDGRWVFTGSYDTTARVWDADTGKPLSPKLQHVGSVLAVAFSPDGRRALTGSEDKTARVWDVSTDDRPPADLIGLAQVWSAHRIDDTGAITPLTTDEITHQWTEFREKYPGEFTVSPQSVRRWREGEIRDCMNERNLRAADFHYWALVAELASGKAR